MASNGISVYLGGPRLLILPGMKAGTAEMLAAAAAAAAFNKLASFSLAKAASFLRSFSSFTKLVAMLRPSPTTLSNPVMMSFTSGKGSDDSSSDCLFFFTFASSPSSTSKSIFAALEGATRGSSTGLEAPDNLETLGDKKESSTLLVVDITGKRGVLVPCVLDEMVFDAEISTMTLADELLSLEGDF